MNEISVQWTGDGSTYVDNYYPNDGDTITLTCIPDPHCSLVDIVAYDEHGYSVALYVQDVQQFTYNESAYGNKLDIYVTFTDTPFIYKNLWILSTRKWWRKNNY